MMMLVMVMILVLMVFRTTLSAKMMLAAALIKNRTGRLLCEFFLQAQSFIFIDHTPAFVINLVFLLLPQA